MKRKEYVQKLDNIPGDLLNEAYVVELCLNYKVQLKYNANLLKKYGDNYKKEEGFYYMHFGDLSVIMEAEDR